MTNFLCIQLKSCVCYGLIRDYFNFFSCKMLKHCSTKLQPNVILNVKMHRLWYLWYDTTQRIATHCVTQRWYLFKAFCSQCAYWLHFGRIAVEPACQRVNRTLFGVCGCVERQRGLSRFAVNGPIQNVLNIT